MKKILIVDDNLSFLEMIKMLMELHDFTCITADNGKIALEKVAEEKPDLILLDLMMPEMDGFQVLCALKNNKDTKNIPVIIVSALKQAENIKKAYSLGAIDYIVKDGDPKYLIDKIKQILIED